ncbi:hypothetical protein GCM10027346_20850 [Hymenobacter seoulensis]
MATETLEEKFARLERENAALEQKAAEQATELATATQAVDELSEKLSNAEAVTPAQAVVTHEKHQYLVLAQKFNYEGTEVLASELQGKKEILAALVKSGSGLLQKIEAKK